MARIVLAAFLILFSVNATAMSQNDPASKFPEPPKPENPGELGDGIQRPMTLMAESTPQRRHRVKVLFYGQSVTNQEWTDRVADWLREEYPHADLQIDNLSLGGFASQKLVRTTDYDVLPHYPDLMIFHVFGDHRRYEDIILKTRRQTTAQIAIWNDHVTELPIPPDSWSDKMSYGFIPDYAERYDCYLMDVRTAWKEYLVRNDLKPQRFLRDGVHLNSNGNWLLSRLIEDRLVFNPDLPRDWRDLVRDYAVGDDVQWQDGRLTLRFRGNRVDVLSSWSGSGEAPAARVLIDGQKPSENPRLYYHARPSGTPHIGWPAIMRIGHERPLVVEKWTLRAWGFNDEADRFKFEVHGSETGPDGRGVSTERFVSDSGRVVIEPDDWVFAFDRRVSKKPMPDEVTVGWRTEPLFVNTVRPRKVEEAAREYPATLAKLLENREHTLTLVAENGTSAPIAALRVYEPPLTPDMEPLHGQPVR